MSVFKALARVDAMAEGKAQPITLFRHLYVHARPLVLIPLAMSGEAAAPLAMMLGSDREKPTLLYVPQPRDRELRDQFFDALAQEVEAYDHVEPQVIVPNRASINFLRLLGRSTRFREGDRIGRWLTYLADRAEHPGSSSLLAATEALNVHWATGQSAREDADLVAVLAWMEGLPPQASATVQPQASATVPWTDSAVPWADPAFDNTVLGPLIDAFDREEPGAADAISQALTARLQTMWDDVWRALDLLRQLPEANSVSERWLWDVAAYTAFMGDPDGPPQPIRDDPVTAAARLDQWERVAARYAAQRAFDDPLVMAAHRLAGEAFRCEVISTEPDRKEGRKLRPQITVRAFEPVFCEVGATLFSPTRRAQPAVVTEMDGPIVVLTLTGGMGRGMVPAAGSVPEVGEVLVYAALSEAFQRPGPLPERTPWTHGGTADQVEGEGAADVDN